MLCYVMLRCYVLTAANSGISSYIKIMTGARHYTEIRTYIKIMTGARHYY